MSLVLQLEKDEPPHADSRETPGSVRNQADDLVDP
jgi:hypothetical protein